MTTLVPSFFDDTTFLQVTRIIIISWMTSNFVKISSPFTKLAALEHLKSY